MSEKETRIQASSIIDSLKEINNTLLLLSSDIKDLTKMVGNSATVLNQAYNNISTTREMSHDNNHQDVMHTMVNNRKAPVNSGPPTKGKFQLLKGDRSPYNPNNPPKVNEFGAPISGLEPPKVEQGEPLTIEEQSQLSTMNG